MTICKSTSLPSLNRRRVLALGAGAAIGACAGFSARPASAVVKLDVTQGNVQPLPIALPEGEDLNDLGRRPGGRAAFFRLVAQARRSTSAESGKEDVCAGK